MKSARSRLISSRFAIASSLLFVAACSRGHKHEGPPPVPSAPCACPPPPPSPRFQPGAATPVPPPSDRAMTVQLDAEPPNLMPALHPDWMSHVIVSHLIEESLVRLDAARGTLEPELATSWEVDSTKTKWTFHLRPKVLWHDGQPFTSDDVVFTLQRIADPSVGAADRALFAGASAHALDPLTVVVALKSPLASAEVAFDRLAILARHRSPRGDLAESPDATAPVGTGPMKFVAWTRGASIEVARWEKHWAGPAPLSKITFRFPPGFGRVLEELEDGDLDVVPRAPADAAKAVEASAELHARYDVVRAGGASYTAWVHDVTSPKLADAHVRRAVGLSIPRDRLRCEVLACNVSIAKGPIPADHPSLLGIDAPAYDPVEAGRQLDQAGVVDHDGDGLREQNGVPFTLKLIVPTTSTDQARIASVVADELRKIGVVLEVMPLEWSQFRRALETHAFELAAIEWTIDREPDLFPLFHSTQSAGSLNYGGYADADVDQWLEERRRGTGDPVALQRALTERLRRDEPYTFLFSPLVVAIVKKGAVNVVPTPLGWQPRAFGWATP